MRRKMKKAVMLLTSALICLTLESAGVYAKVVDGNDYVQSEYDETMGADDEIYSEYIYNYHDDGTRIAPITHSADSPSMASLLPVKYDGRTEDYMPMVRNQGSYGTCWAFAAMNCAEVSTLRKRLKDVSADNLNLSEIQLAYFFYNRVEDPLGGTAGDYTKPLGKTYMQVGGNNNITIFALANWIGAADENADISLVYPAASGLNPVLDKEWAFNDYVHMQNAYRVSMQDMDIVKQLIMDYGTLAVSYYYIRNFGKRDDESKDLAYYQNRYTTTNHAVSLVGWDDEYPKENFSDSESDRPQRDGAWLIKDSHGSSASNSGYIWISYEDISLSSSDAVMMDFESADNYDNNYQYDGGSGNWTVPLQSGGSMANVFTAHANNGGYEELKAVSFATTTHQINYTIKVYKNLKDASKPDSGVLAATQRGRAEYAGYYTVNLDEVVSINEGENFSVVVTLSRDDNNQIFCCFDTSFQNSWIEFECTAEERQSFAKNTEDDSWVDYSNREFKPGNFRIKAFTDNKDAPNSIEMNIKQLQLDLSNKDYKNAANLSVTFVPESNSGGVIWQSSDEKTVKVDEEGNVVACGNGTAVITAVSKVNRDIKAVCNVEVKTSLTGISLDRKELMMECGGTEALKVSYIPALTTDEKEVIWASSDEKVAKVDEKGNINACGSGTAVITAVSKINVEISDVCHVTVKGNESHEDDPVKKGDQGNTEVKSEASSQNQGENNNSTQQSASVGDIITDPVSRNRFKIISSDSVRFVTAKNVKNGKCVISDSVTVFGKKYKVTEISPKAFYKSTWLKKIEIGRNIKKIGDKAFYGCKNLKSVNVKSKVLKTIGKNAFRGCKNLKQITIKSTKLTKKSVGNNAFKGTSRKLTIKVPSKKLSVYKRYFRNAGNKKVKVKKG